MKAILVIDMPKMCGKCPLHMEYDYENGECFNESEIKLNGKPDWCPLKPMPIKRKTSVDTDLFEQGVGYGWNDCLEELEK